MLRDKLRDTAYYDEYVTYTTKRIEKLVKKIDHTSQLSDAVKMRNSLTLLENSMYLLHQKYSRGDNLPNLNPIYSRRLSIGNGKKITLTHYRLKSKKSVLAGKKFVMII